MHTLNFVNLIQAAIVGTGLLGCLLLWRVLAYRGVAILLLLTAFAAGINIAEESGLTRDIYLISPVFIMLFGPATYLAIKHLTTGNHERSDYLHLLPVVPILFITDNVQLVIAIGTAWRLAYALGSAKLLLQYKKSLDESRSDADEFSLTWLMWVVIATALFNLIDLIRLNSQHLIAAELNIFGQGLNNAIWLVVVMAITLKLMTQGKPPKRNNKPVKTAEADNIKTDTSQEDYQSIFTELDKLVTENKWFIKPRLTLANLSDLTGLQTRDISRAINLNSQKSFNEYINQYRIEFVCQILKQNQATSLTTVYLDAGFSSKATFNKVFKQVMAMTPSEYKADN